MPSITLAVDADVATWSSGIAAGAGDHLPIGDYGSADYRSAIRFAAPAWSGWTDITKATLTFYISDFRHVGPRSSSIYCKRQSIGSLWTKGEGTQDCESGFSGGNTSQYSDISPTSTDQVTFTSGTTENAKKSITVTGQVKYYRDNGASKIVFVFDNVGSGDYTELWSKGKVGGYNAALVIDYTDNVPPTIPTLGLPVSGSTVVSQTPTLSWTHNDPDGDPQASAQVRIWDNAGTTQIGATQTVSGTGASLVWPASLTRGTTYRFDVRTADASGYGPWSGQRPFTIKALPVVAIDATRRQEYSGGKVCLRVNWTVTGGTQTRYRIQSSSPAYDSGFVTSTSQSVLLTSPTVVNGSATNITVTVETSDVLQSVPVVRSFTPRWGQTVHRRDLTTAPVGWGTPTIGSTVPSGATLVMEYGSAATAVAAPSTWYSSMSSVPKARYVFYRATLIPSSSASPVLDKVTIPANYTAATADHWYASLSAGLPAGPIATPWTIDDGEYVYGTRSISVDTTGAVLAVYSERIRVRAGRSYLLTGLMKAQGNPGMSFGLFDPDTGAYVLGVDGLNVTSEVLSATRDWFQPDRNDTYRYKTQVFIPPSDNDVVIRLQAQGAAGASGWWDGLKLEESTVATPWGPSAVGAVAADAGGVQVDGTKGGVFRVRGSAGGVRDYVTLGARGLTFGASTQVYDTGGGDLAVQNPAGNSILRALGSAGEAASVYSAFAIQRGADSTSRMIAGYAGDVQRTGMFMGDGTNARDTNVWRSGVGQLNTDNEFRVGETFAVQGVITPTTLAAATNNYDPAGGIDAYCWRLSSDATVRAISGIIGPPHVQGMQLQLINLNAVTVIQLLNESALSTSVNRILTPSAATYAINPGAVVQLYYDLVSTRWRVVA